MSKVKIQGNASGTGVLTVTAPNTSTDSTITLPDATGTLLNSDGSGANLTNLPNGSQLDYSGTKKIEATATGVSVTGASYSTSNIGLNADNHLGFSDDSWARLVVNDTEICRVLSTGDVNINSGNLVIGTNGKGIDFSAASNASSMTSELLDDYEEGLHTTSAGVGSGSITLNSTNNKFYYTKIGRQVTITGRIDVDSVSSPTGDIYFTLPFASAAAGGSQNSSSAGGLFVWNPTSGDSGLWVTWLDSSGSNVYFRYASGNQASPAANLVQAATEFRIGLSYMTD